MAPIKFKRLHDAAKIPTRATPTDAGLDLTTPEAVTVPHDHWFPTRVSLGLAWECPRGWAGLIVSRSSLGARGLVVHAGMIDAGHRGPIEVVLSNLGYEPITVAAGDRIAQLILVPVPDCEVVEVEDLGPGRESAGWGGTGR